MIPIGEIPQLAACHRQRGTRECKVCASTIASGIGGSSTLGLSTLGSSTLETV